MSEEDTVVEEEYLVYAELCDNTDPNIFSHAETSFKSFGLDSDQPILTIGGQAFVGKYKDTVGTAVFLEQIPPGTAERIGFGNEPSDPLFVDSPSQKLQYVCHTRKSLEMSRVLLIEKKKKDQESAIAEVNEDCFPDNDVIASSGEKDLSLEHVEVPTDLQHNICLDSDEVELQNVILPSMMEGQMIKNIENMKIISHANG